MTRHHDLKCWIQFFGEVWKGDKTHEVRRDDRDYAVGDTVRLHEFLPDRKMYTGRSVLASISSITHPGPIGGNARLPEGVCVFSFVELSRLGADL